MLKIALLYPELLGTYGDGGNALVLAARARRRGIAVEVVSVSIDEDIPAADVFLLGGGEDGPQRQATFALAKSRALATRIDDGATLLAVCAGFQIIGTSYEVDGGLLVDGLGLIDATTTRGEKRHVGNLLTGVGESFLVGFENHGGETALGEHEQGLGNVLDGVGNAKTDWRGEAVDGVRRGGIFATYAHGPVLALNPWFADALLESALGYELEPLATIADELHRARVQACGF